MATIEQLKKAIRDRESQIVNLKTEISNLISQLKEQSDFKVGDFVKVGKQNWSNKEFQYHNVYISAIELDFRNDFRYKFSKQKQGPGTGRHVAMFILDPSKKIA